MVASIVAYILTVILGGLGLLGVFCFLFTPKEPGEFYLAIFFLFAAYGCARLAGI